MLRHAHGRSPIGVAIEAKLAAGTTGMIGSAWIVYHGAAHRRNRIRLDCAIRDVDTRSLPAGKLAMKARRYCPPRSIQILPASSDRVITIWSAARSSSIIESPMFLVDNRLL